MPPPVHIVISAVPSPRRSSSSSAVPIRIEQGQIPLRIESYEAFQTIARTTIEKLKMKRSKDPRAGRPIIGTAAARALDPVRDRQARQAARAQAASERQQSSRKQADRAGSRSAGQGPATDPPAAAGQGT